VLLPAFVIFTPTLFEVIFFFGLKARVKKIKKKKQFPFSGKTNFNEPKHTTFLVC